jgi:hypothetical protein
MVRFTERAKVSLFEKVQTGCGVYEAFYSMNTADISSTIKWPSGELIANSILSQV